MKKNTSLLKMIYAAICLALCMLLPFLTGQIPQIGSMLSPMHIPVFLCGFLCGPIWGLGVGMLAPLLRFALFGMPLLFPTGIAMALELAAYGVLSGLLDHALPKKAWALYLTLFLSMVGGRIVWGAAQFVLLGFTGTPFPFSAFLAGAVTNAVPGIILHFLLIPVLVLALRRAGLSPEEQ